MQCEEMQEAKTQEADMRNVNMQKAERQEKSAQEAERMRTLWTGSKKDFLFLYMSYHKQGAGLCIFFFSIFLCTFALYHLPVDAVIYPAFLCFLFGLLFLCLNFYRAWRKHCRIGQLAQLPPAMMENFPECSSWEGDDYRRLVEKLKEGQLQMEDRMNMKFFEMVDYYTLWAHQIKTPIASMRLNLQNEDSQLSRTVSEDLLRIEQYVEMVLAYLRLNAQSTDYVLKEQDLDDVIRQSVKRFAGWFIGRKIGLEFTPTQIKAVTDEKWLGFVIEQVLSNALKYTEAGTIRIYRRGEAAVCIQDTGIGIASQDLPRIFEKGYTGYNGRSDKRASGIGLYLCRRICENLGHTITAASVPGEGTTITIDLGQRKMNKE